MRFFRSLICDEHAATAVEYAVMLALIILTAVAAIASFGDATNGYFIRIDSEMSDHGIK